MPKTEKAKSKKFKLINYNIIFIEIIFHINAIKKTYSHRVSMF